MEGRFSELELEFISEVLYQHADYLDDILSEAIDQKNLIKEGLLSGSREFNVTKYGINPVLQVSFPDYGRFIEINYHKRSQNTRDLKKMHEEAQNAIWARKNRAGKIRKKKDTRWYAKSAYGSINRLIGMIMYEFTEEEKQRIRQIIENRKTFAS